MTYLDFIISLRGLVREKSYVLLNVLGISLAFACAMALVPYALQQLDHDRHYQQHENIFRIAYDYHTGGSSSVSAEVSPFLGLFFFRDNPDMGDYVRIYRRGRSYYRTEETGRYWDDVYNATEDYFKIFDHDIIYGDAETALQDPYSIAISENFAKNYFGDANPIGQTIQSDLTEHHVTLVFKDQPDNTHIKFSALTSFNLSRLQSGDAIDNPAPILLWGLGGYSFFRIKPEYTVDNLRTALSVFYDKHMREYGEANDQFIRFIVQPLAEIHFSLGFDHDQPVANKVSLYGLLGLALLVLIIAGINNVNLATARAGKYTKAIQIRLTLGANSRQLYWQLVIENWLLSCLAVFCGIVLIELGGIVFNFQSASWSVGAGTNAAIYFLILLLFTLVYALVISFYPAYFHSRGAVNRTRLINYNKMIGLNGRSILIFTQLLASITVMAITLLMAEQLSFINNKDLGFKTQNQIAIPLHTADVIEKVPLIKQALLRHSGVEGLSSSFYIPGGLVQTSADHTELTNGKMERFEAKQIYGDQDYIDTMGLEIIAGTDFAGNPYGESVTPVIVNEAFVKAMNWQQPLGKQVEIYQSPESRVVGVVKDFNYWSLHQPINPLRIVPYPDNEFANGSARLRQTATRYLIVSLAHDQSESLLPTIQSVMQEFDPMHSFEYENLQTYVDHFYLQENQQIKFIRIFTLASLVITGLGLLGFIAYTTAQQSKSIGIRKVIGAGQWDLYILFLKPIVVMTLAASALASVLSYVGIQQWLSYFSYHADLGFTPYLLASGAVLVFACLAISQHLWKVTSRNPVEALRYE